MMHFESAATHSSSASMLQHHRALEIKKEYRAEKAAFHPPASPLAAGRHTPPPQQQQQTSSQNSTSTPTQNTTPQSRPLPAFFAESASFSTKRERETPRQLHDLNPPRPPIKSCPPISRIRPQRRHEHDGARPVSFKNNLASLLVNNDNSDSGGGGQKKKTAWSSLTNFCHHNDSSSSSPTTNIVDMPPSTTDSYSTTRHLPNVAADLTSTFYDDSKHGLYFEQCFVIQGSLGCGSFGKVYKVKSKEDGELYAVKKSREKFKGHSDRSRKLEEVAKHEQLPPHPNCVKFYRAWEEKQRLYIQTELCQMSLSAYAEQCHDIPETTIWQFLVDLLLAVKHLHDRQLVHMDIKPDNVFVSFDGYCKLGDFGLVVDLKKPEDVREVQEGDPRYLAPEVLNGHVYVSKAADIFSLGMTILELATDLELPRGDAPWHQLREGAESTRSHIPARILNKLSDELLQIIFRMLEPDYTKRASVNELLDHVKVKRLLAARQRVAFVAKFRSALSDNRLVKWMVDTWRAARTWNVWQSVRQGCVKCGQCVVLFLAWLQKKPPTFSNTATNTMIGSRRSSSGGYRRLSLVNNSKKDADDVRRRGSGDNNNNSSDNSDYLDKQNTSTPKKDDSMNLIQLSMIHIDDEDDDHHHHHHNDHRGFLNDSLNEKNNSFTNHKNNSSNSSMSMSDHSDCYISDSKKLWPNKTKEEILMIHEEEEDDQDDDNDYKTRKKPSGLQKQKVKSKSSYVSRVKEPTTTITAATPLSSMRTRLLYDDEDDNDDIDDEYDGHHGNYSNKEKPPPPPPLMMDSLDELPKITTNRSKFLQHHHPVESKLLISTPQSFITAASVLADKQHLVKRHNLSSELDLSMVTLDKRD